MLGSVGIAIALLGTEGAATVMELQGAARLVNVRGELQESVAWLE